jgi:hypothetical protein
MIHKFGVNPLLAKRHTAPIALKTAMERNGGLESGSSFNRWLSPKQPLKSGCYLFLTKTNDNSKRRIMRKLAFCQGNSMPDNFATEKMIATAGRGSRTSIAWIIASLVRSNGHPHRPTVSRWPAGYNPSLSGQETRPRVRRSERH